MKDCTSLQFHVSFANPAADCGHNELEDDKTNHTSFLLSVIAQCFPLGLLRITPEWLTHLDSQKLQNTAKINLKN